LYSPSQRRNALTAAILLMLLLVSAGLILYLYGELTVVSAGYAQASRQSQTLRMTLRQINMTAPIVTVCVDFTPAPPIKVVKPNTVTFLIGYVTITNLTEIYTPAILTVTFTVDHLTTNPKATIQYDWVRSQTVNLVKGVQTVEVPAGIFPLGIYNVKPGDQVQIFMTAKVQVTWQPVGAVMATQTATAMWTIYIGE